MHSTLQLRDDLASMGGGYVFTAVDLTTLIASFGSKPPLCGEPRCTRLLEAEKKNFSKTGSAMDIGLHSPRFWEIKPPVDGYSVSTQLNACTDVAFPSVHGF